MNYADRLQMHPPIDSPVAARAPPLSELENPTLDAIYHKHTGTAAKVSRSIGSGVTAAEDQEIVSRLV